jgi:prepilin-type N-terminal cleavage/methylation domain-containing protein
MLSQLRRRLAARLAGDAGVSLVEMLAAMVILGVVLTALAASSITALASVKSAQDQTAANQLANEVVETLMARPWASVAPPAVVSFPVRTVRGMAYTTTVTVTWQDNPCNNRAPVTQQQQQDYLLFDVDITWQLPSGPARALEIQTLRAPTQAEKPTEETVTGAC